VEDEIVEFVVTMDDAEAELGFVRKIGAVPADELVEEWDVTGFAVGFDVGNGGLDGGDFGERFDLAGEVRGGRAEGAEADGGRVDRA